VARFHAEATPLRRHHLSSQALPRAQRPWGCLREGRKEQISRKPGLPSWCATSGTSRPSSGESQEATPGLEKREKAWGRHAGTDGAHGGIAICGALFTARRSDIRKYYPRAARFRLHPHLTIPSCAPSIRPRNCTNGGQFRDLEDLTGYWIGDLQYTKREGRL
jgi:hypothetical protein